MSEIFSERLLRSVSVQLREEPDDDEEEEDDRKRDDDDEGEESNDGYSE
jgi:hypothetical protein